MQLLGYSWQLLECLGWLPRCCYVVAKVPGAVARVLLGGC